MSADNIKVSVRLRSLLARERDAGAAFKAIDDKSLQYGHENWSFDRVFNPKSTNEDVFHTELKPIVESCADGFNGTIFAYGQTGSGKTHTVFGTDEDAGVLRRSVYRLFEIMAENETTREYMVRMSVMEIYNEKIIDLLLPNNNKEKKEYKIRETMDGTVFVQGIREIVVMSSEEIFRFVKKAFERRHIGATNMNERSSRSHTIVHLIIESRATACEEEAVKVSHLNVIDLAGSERARDAGTDGVRLKEGSSINNSLLTLGLVIQDLVEKKDHVRYRDSTLTRLLSNSLGKNARTAIVCMISPAAIPSFIEQSRSTLNFAMCARKVKCNAHVNEILSDDAMMKRQAREIAELRRQLDSGTQSTHVRQLEEEKKAMARLIGQKDEREQELLQRIQVLQQQVINRRDATECSAGSLLAAKRRRETWAPGNFYGSVPDLSTGTVFSGDHRFVKRRKQHRNVRFARPQPTCTIAERSFESDSESSPTEQSQHDGDQLMSVAVQSDTEIDETTASPSFVGANSPQCHSRLADVDVSPLGEAANDVLPVLQPLSQLLSATEKIPASPIPDRLQGVHLNLTPNPSRRSHVTFQTVSVDSSPLAKSVGRSEVLDNNDCTMKEVSCQVERTPTGRSNEAPWLHRSFSTKQRRTNSCLDLISTPELQRRTDPTIVWREKYELLNAETQSLVEFVKNEAVLVKDDELDALRQEMRQQVEQHEAASALSNKKLAEMEAKLADTLKETAGNDMLLKEYEKQLEVLELQRMELKAENKRLKRQASQPKPVGISVETAVSDSFTESGNNELGALGNLASSQQAELDRLVGENRQLQQKLIEFETQRSRELDVESFCYGARGSTTLNIAEYTVDVTTVAPCLADELRELNEPVETADACTSPICGRSLLQATEKAETATGMSLLQLTDETLQTSTVATTNQEQQVSLAVVDQSLQTSHPDAADFGLQTSVVDGNDQDVQTSLVGIDQALQTSQIGVGELSAQTSFVDQSAPQLFNFQQASCQTSFSSNEAFVQTSLVNQTNSDSDEQRLEALLSENARLKKLVTNREEVIAKNEEIARNYLKTMETEYYKRFDQLRSKALRKQQEIHKIQADLAASVAEVAKLKEQLNSPTAETELINELRQQLSAADTRAIQMESTHQAEVGRLQEQLDAHLAEKDLLRIEVDSKQVVVDELTAARQVDQANIVDLKKQLDKSEARCSKLSTDVDMLRYAGPNKNIGQVEKKLLETEIKLDQALKKIGLLEKEKKEKESEASTTYNKYQRLKQHYWILRESSKNNKENSNSGDGELDEAQPSRPVKKPSKTPLE